MRREIRRRLEKALITLQEPNGSTIRSIIKVINKEAPILSLRKVLEALQEGINEGFLCMYNGRFKLKQQIPKGKSFMEEDVFDSDDCLVEERDNEERPRNLEDEFYDDELYDDESQFEFTKDSQSPYGGKEVKERHTKRGPKTSVKQKYTNKNKGKTRKRSKKFNELVSEQDDIASSSALEHLTTSYGVPQRPTAEKPDLKKQRGPRCTSMKKDVRMPSKVQIPFVLPTVPQKCSTFNEFVRRSPERVNGPLFGDCNNFSLKPDKLEFFNL